MIIVEGGQQESVNKNTGAKDQFLEKPTVRYAVALPDQEFSSLENFKSLTAWNTAISEKKIFPFYEIEELTNADTEDTFFEGNSKYLTNIGKKIRTFNMMISLHSHAAVKSFNGKLVRIYEFTDGQEIKGVVDTDGVKIKGQLVRIEVGKRVDAVADKPAFTPVTLNYEDFNEFENAGAIVKPTWSHVEINGIFDLVLKVVSATSTKVVFTANTLIGNAPVKTLVSGNVILENASGVAQTVTFTAADANGRYELAGTGFATNYRLRLNGVVTTGGDHYEGVAAVAITV